MIIEFISGTTNIVATFFINFHFMFRKRKKTHEDLERSVFLSIMPTCYFLCLFNIFLDKSVLILNFSFQFILFYSDSNRLQSLRNIFVNLAVQKEFP